MNKPIDSANELLNLALDEPVNLSRRRFLTGTAVGALVLGFGLPLGSARVLAATATAAERGTQVPAFLEIRPDGSVRLLSPFMEGGQGTHTAMAQIVGEELDADPATFVVESAPPGEAYVVMENGLRITGGSMSVRMSYPTMRRLGALARAMLLQAGAEQLGVPVAELSTEPGRVLHAASGRSLGYGELAGRALDMPVPDPASITLRDPSQFRWIGKPVRRVDAYEKSTGKALYSIDLKVDGMLHAAVQHAPRLGMTVGSLRNEAQVKAMKGVHSVHQLPGAVAVVAERWWHAKRAVEAIQVDWQEAAADSKVRTMPADFSSDAFRDFLAAQQGPARDDENEGDVAAALASAKTQVEATYHNQYLNHAQLEPPSALARFNPDGSLEVWLPNQAPDMFRDDIARRTGLSASQITLHSPLLGGFFGRHFLYDSANPYPQAIALAKAVGRPVKLIWSREEEFVRDVLRPVAVVKFRAALDAEGLPVAIEAVSATEGPTEAIAGKQGEKIDPTAVEGLSGKSYAIANKRIAQIYVKGPAMLGYWRSVGNSLNDFFYEAFLDELADKGGRDPYELRQHLLRDNPRLTTLLQAVGELSGGWKRGPFTAEDGSRRARGVAMASPFGSQTAVIAEVSIERGQVKVHDIWQAIDPGSIVNPAIVEAQVNGAVALGLSQTLLEEAVYVDGKPRARNYDLYPILPLSRMARVHVRIVESGEKMGGIGEPPLPAVAPAVANAVARLTGQRIRSLPLSRYTFS
ncbi:xanthine dehydrogenase family protein molybdopterin-binding subunit [Pseudomonas chlororaphis]|uniref:xanthine dehydrogenase family protein molybdopterin-binding subunit n=1 Tax=Pseudomonas chlororaphis TaxID=587753 RepID=UPI0007B3A348|nr:molybdopterin cofactor-binding domain-containing protein [Pseudomonas chlororaphis]AZC50773.1 Isoquinoline 1-oxidoreductase beta subunit [Pseudomonas chlororaphis subsp. piscium]AZC57345.1 Isoquinoline 1-oxidoreductase beta subunit [Pseudomonas chlororaphis subsp. piscium]AZC63543.1 Isoquinoline 1-oxidoreductase beta subunit [Pseudomonas chlororaphis subsp. piscium]AZC75983.1 Isoquinoline 1-oxidoreductase beta subunit [Pseudomonas chlororaphis subsp. piscium]AZC95828.1 Isoquinoline 1-oxidor